MERISSRQNPIVKRFRAVADSSPDYLLLDGEHLLEEALASGFDIDVVAVGDTLANGKVSALADAAHSRGARLLGVSQTVLSAMSPVRHPSGIVAIARRRTVPLEAAFEHSPQLVLMLSDIQDPGNVGAIVRAADACGATGVIAGEGTADPFGWKALRGSMGSAFHIPVVARQSLEAAADAAHRHGLRVYAAMPRDGTPLPRCALDRPAAILLGGEGSGIPPRLLPMSDERLTIPMRRVVESLNVATAAALIVYEAQRQREGAHE
jgi:RNA methyltransferase, TrmH family